MTATQTGTRCIDSGTDLMTLDEADGTARCGNCGGTVAVLEVPLRPDDPDDHNTIRVLSEHTAPVLNETVTHVPNYAGHWKGEAYLTHHTYGVQVHRNPDEAERWNATQQVLRPA